MADHGSDDHHRAPARAGAPPDAGAFDDDLRTEIDAPRRFELSPAESIHVQPTQEIAVRPRRTQPAAVRPTPATTSLVAVMRHDAIARAPVFLRVLFAIIAADLLLVLVTAGDPVARRVLVIGSIVAALAALRARAVTRNAATFQERHLVVPALALALAAITGVYYWGVGSPVAALVVYGLYFFTVSAEHRITTVAYALVAGLHGALGLGIATGALADRGVIAISGLAVREQLAIVAIIEALYLAAYYTARISRRATLDAMYQLKQAVRDSAQRDALLAEARAELDQALKIGGPGRFTGQTVGAFRLGVLIGRGGMGEVYAANAIGDAREAAVKLLQPGTAAEPVRIERFLREAQAAGRLDCPHVVRVFEVGTTSGKVPFLAMERLHGTDLAHQLREPRRMNLLDSKVMIDQLAIGLEAARIAGIVHRDLKPHNVFLAEDGGLRRWKILDFGVAKSGGSGTLTQGQVVGTPAYMSPEQARGEDVDHRADVYSLAAIAFRAVTGHRVFAGKDVPSTLYDVVYRTPSQPSSLASLPPDVDRVLAIGLAKDPRDRFGFALELARWFAAAVTRGLDPDQRRRGDDLIARCPWGAAPGADR